MELLDFPSKKYTTGYIDPPWAFAVRSPKGEGRSAKNHYPTMDLTAIKNLPVSDIMEKDAAILVWAIDPMLPEAFDTIKHWGFTYKTVGFYWAKENRCSPGWFMGTGYWTRANPEICLLATRGHPKRLNSDVRRLVVSKRREHSRKPDEMYGHIERLLPGPYVELFARTTRPGWDSWGNQTEKFAEGDK